jgi:HAD superfamily hydrolase (TIGR01509 family)
VTDQGRPLPRAVIFDVGNVLVRLRPIGELRPSGWERAGASPAGGGPPIDPLISLRTDPVLDRFERGRATAGEFCDAIRRAFGTSLGDEEILRVYNEVLGEPMPGMEDLIEDLLARGVRVVGLSDTSAVHLALLDRYPAVRALETLIASCSTSHRKPEPGAYRAALASAGSRPEETLFVDDQPANVEGARALGMRAIVFEGAESVRAYLGL